MTHVGAKSGGLNSALVYFTNHRRVILIATNFGGSRNPAWYHNIEANPLMTLYGCSIRGRFMADTVSSYSGSPLTSQERTTPCHTTRLHETGREDPRLN
jgi:deazaflavin-dependent oxidoreductase (nitroreductase family)